MTVIWRDIVIAGQTVLHDAFYNLSWMQQNLLPLSRQIYAVPDLCCIVSLEVGWVSW